MKYFFGGYFLLCLLLNLYIKAESFDYYPLRTGLAGPLASDQQKLFNRPTIKPKLAHDPETAVPKQTLTICPEPELVSVRRERVPGRCQKVLRDTARVAKASQEGVWPDEGDHTPRTEYCCRSSPSCSSYTATLPKHTGQRKRGST